MELLRSSRLAFQASERREGRSRRFRTISLALALAASGCSIGTSTADADLDPLSPAVLAQLGLGPQDDVAWSRSVAGIAVIGVGTRADAAELELLGAALAEIPEPVKELAAIRNIVRVTDLPDADLHPATLALARGPDIFLLDRTFAGLGPEPSAFALAEILAHEITHVAQFAALGEDEVAALLAGEGPADPITDSHFVREFAAAAGWNDAGSSGAPSWIAPATAGASEYARSDPEEDMAETVAALALGRAALLSRERREWAEDWIGQSAAQLAKGKPYVPAGAVPIESATPLYDETAPARYGPQHIEPMSFLLPPDAPDHDALVADVHRELAARSLSGALTPVPDSPAPRSSGYYLRGDGIGFWVEVWEFRDSGYTRAPDGPVITYVVLR